MRCPITDAREAPMGGRRVARAERGARTQGRRGGKGKAGREWPMRWSCRGAGPGAWRLSSLGTSPLARANGSAPTQSLEQRPDMFQNENVHLAWCLLNIPARKSASASKGIVQATGRSRKKGGREGDGKERRKASAQMTQKSS